MFQGDYLWAKNPRRSLFGDLPDAQAEKWTKRLKHHPARNYHSKTTHEPWKYVPCVYLKCADDATIPVEVQSVLASKIPDCEVEVCYSGHCPFLSQPTKVVQAIVKAAEKSSKDVGA